MTITAALVAEGSHHAVVSGTIDVGAGNGQVPALGVNQLLKLPLPFPAKQYTLPGFEEQFYVIAKPLDANVTGIRLDAVQFEYPVGAPPNLRLRIDISAAPGAVEIWLEAHHSIGR